MDNSDARTPTSYALHLDLTFCWVVFVLVSLCLSCHKWFWTGDVMFEWRMKDMSLLFFCSMRTRVVKFVEGGSPPQTFQSTSRPVSWCEIAWHKPLKPWAPTWSSGFWRVPYTSPKRHKYKCQINRKWRWPLVIVIALDWAVIVPQASSW